MKHLEVVAAILEYDGKILCMERGQGKFEYVSFKYEFPGGKIEPGEKKHEAIERELREEMDVHVSVREEDLYMTVHHDYPDFSISSMPFAVVWINPILSARNTSMPSGWRQPICRPWIGPRLTCRSCRNWPESRRMSWLNTEPGTVPARRLYRLYHRSRPALCTENPDQ